MSEQRHNATAELRKVSCRSFPEIFARYQSLADEYGDLSPEGLIAAFRSVNGFG